MVEIIQQLIIFKLNLTYKIFVPCSFKINILVLVLETHARNISKLNLIKFDLQNICSLVCLVLHRDHSLSESMEMVVKT